MSGPAAGPCSRPSRCPRNAATIRRLAGGPCFPRLGPPRLGVGLGDGISLGDGHGGGDTRRLGADGRRRRGGTVGDSLVDDDGDILDPRGGVGDGDREQGREPEKGVQRMIAHLEGSVQSVCCDEPNQKRVTGCDNSYPFRRHADGTLARRTDQPTAPRVGLGIGGRLKGTASTASAPWAPRPVAGCAHPPRHRHDIAVQWVQAVQCQCSPKSRSVLFSTSQTVPTAPSLPSMWRPAGPRPKAGLHGSASKLNPSGATVSQPIHARLHPALRQAPPRVQQQSHGSHPRPPQLSPFNSKPTKTCLPTPAWGGMHHLDVLPSAANPYYYI